jgi:hypothetical protein
VGLPELAALASLTGDRKYEVAFQDIKRHLPRPVLNSYRDFYHSQKLSAGIDEHLNGHRIPFFVNVGLARHLTGDRDFDTILGKLSIYSLGGENISALIPLLLIFPELSTVPFFQEESPKFLLTALEQFYFNGSNFVPTVYLMTSLEQMGMVPLLEWRFGGDARGTWAGALQNLLDAIPANGIYSGTRTTSERRKLPDGILHSEFFALWMKAAALIAAKDSPLAKAVFNEAGHVLAL